MNTKLWTCKDGRKIRIRDMEDSHLLNTIRMLQRAHHRQELECIAASSMARGEMAQWSLENEASAMAEAGPSRSYPIYDDLVEEAIRRSLIKPEEEAGL